MGRLRCQKSVLTHNGERQRLIDLNCFLDDGSAKTKNAGVDICTFTGGAVGAGTPACQRSLSPARDCSSLGGEALRSGVTLTLCRPELAEDFFVQENHDAIARPGHRKMACIRVHVRLGNLSVPESSLHHRQQRRQNCGLLPWQHSTTSTAQQSVCKRVLFIPL